MAVRHRRRVHAQALSSGDPTTTSSSTSSSGQIPWNLDRIDQRTNVLDNKYNPAGDGSNVDIYIIDTGVRDTHQDLRGRVFYAGFDAVDVLTGSNKSGTDCDGHGTHCAGIAAGSTYGVAKNASIYNLRALDCDGTGAVSGIVLGIDRIIQHHKLQRDSDGGGRPIVISQSLDIPDSASLNKAVEEATEVGVVCVGAAGNQATYSCLYSPAGATAGIAVGATDRDDHMATSTNFGECTTIMAPGEAIMSTSYACDTCTVTYSGTSMAAPHVAGYAAILLGLEPGLTPAQVKERMLEQSTKDCVVMSSAAAAQNRAGLHRTPNRLLYVESRSSATAADTGGEASGAT